MVSGTTLVEVAHRCPSAIEDARLYVHNPYGLNEVILPATLDPVVFVWDSARTGFGWTTLRAGLMGCVESQWEWTERHFVIVGESVPPLTISPPVTPPEFTLPTVDTEPPPPAPEGPDVDVTLRVTHWNAVEDASHVYARCALRVPAGSGLGAVLDAAQEDGCITSWIPWTPAVYPDDVACIDAMCDTAWFSGGAGTTYWRYPRPLSVAGGEVVSVDYYIDRRSSCDQLYAC